MKCIRELWLGHPGRVLLRGVVAFVFLTPVQAFSAIDAQPAAEEATEAQVPAKAEPTRDVAPSGVKPAAEPSEDYKATKKIPQKLLRVLLGCWQLDGQERWAISRLDASGAQVITKVMKPAKKRSDRVPFPDSARRAAVPATLMYDTKQDNFGFSTAGRSRATLVVFKHSGAILEASLFSKRSSKHPFAFTGYSATLERCKVPARARAAGARPAAIPPRLK
jgi:hypothetical protein